MLLESSGGLSVGQMARLKFLLPNSNKPLSLLASVLRQDRPDRIALQFIEIGPEERQIIHDFVSGEAAG